MKVLFWPFYMLWAFVGFLFSILGRFLAAIIGVALLLVGGILTATVVGAIVGIPLLVTGGAMVLRSIF